MIRHEVPSGVKNEELSRYLLRAWPLLPGHVLRELLKKKDAYDIYNMKHPIYTKVKDEIPAKYGEHADVQVLLLVRAQDAERREVPPEQHGRRRILPHRRRPAEGC